ncbi:SRPBCC family protein [Amycolatopsis regifaucium]|uniref:SRPBCC family protein n=1 Tax=Amycolatopsis regifaucium TaxID=546365 RepID=UPI00244D65BD|nr:SRPBCC family protein [Amycolatopsis regifaucium]
MHSTEVNVLRENTCRLLRVNAFSPLNAVARCPAAAFRGLNAVVIALEPGKRFGYTLRKGLPLRDYRAYVDLTPDRKGTDVHWHSTFTAKIPGTGWFYRRFLGRFLGRMVESLVAGASRGAP